MIFSKLLMRVFFYVTGILFFICMQHTQVIFPTIFPRCVLPFEIVLFHFIILLAVLSFLFSVHNILTRQPART